MLRASYIDLVKLGFKPGLISSIVGSLIFIFISFSGVDGRLNIELNLVNTTPFLFGLLIIYLPYNQFVAGPILKLVLLRNINLILIVLITLILGFVPAMFLLNFRGFSLIDGLLRGYNIYVSSEFNIICFLLLFKNHLKKKI